MAIPDHDVLKSDHIGVGLAQLEGGQLGVQQVGDHLVVDLGEGDALDCDGSVGEPVAAEIDITGGALPQQVVQVDGEVVVQLLDWLWLLHVLYYKWAYIMLNTIN